MRALSRPLNVIRLNPSSPVEYAIMHYRKNSQVDFFKDLADYMKEGIVVVRPTCFLMCKLVWITTEKHGVKHAWFVRYGVGDLRELLQCLPPSKIEWIAFNRRGCAKDHVWPLKRMMDLAYREQRT